MLRFGKTALTKQILIVSARDAVEKQKPPKFASLKFNADLLEPQTRSRQIYKAAPTKTR